MLKDFIKILDVRVTTKTTEELFIEINVTIEQNIYGKTLFCANPHSLVKVKRDDFLLSCFNNAAWILPDGIGVVLATKLFGQKNIKRITGYDMMIKILYELNNSGSGTIFFLGSTNDVLNKMRRRINTEFPNLKTHYFSPPFVDEFANRDNAHMIDLINKTKSGVLFIGMSTSKQEKWAYKHKDKLTVPVIAAVGAAFDFYAGTKKRAPIIFQAVGLEWLWRLIYEPTRLWNRTVISIPIFIYHIMKQFISENIISLL